jgi:hypothetical protein
MTRIQLIREIRKLKPQLRVTVEFERALFKRGFQDGSRGAYASQKEHWLGWLSEYDGPGFYDRKNAPPQAAKTIYNRIVCPPMLLWLAEASGIEKRTLSKAERAALYGKTFMAQSAAIRRIIPWENIESRLRQK